MQAHCKEPTTSNQTPSPAEEQHYKQYTQPEQISPHLDGFSQGVQACKHTAKSRHPQTKHHHQQKNSIAGSIIAQADFSTFGRLQPSCPIIQPCYKEPTFSNQAPSPAEEQHCKQYTQPEQISPHLDGFGQDVRVCKHAAKSRPPQTKHHHQQKNNICRQYAQSEQIFSYLDGFSQGVQVCKHAAKSRPSQTKHHRQRKNNIASSTLSPSRFLHIWTISVKLSKYETTLQRADTLKPTTITNRRTVAERHRLPLQARSAPERAHRPREQ